MKIPYEFDKSFTLDVARVTESAAIAAYEYIGSGKEKQADAAAVYAMRQSLNNLPIHGVVVIGEGERDEAPMLYIGEEVGTQSHPKLDIALDPLEGTSLTVLGMNGASTVLALSEENGLLHAPDVYMEKLAVGPNVNPNSVGLHQSLQENVLAIAKQKNIFPNEVKVLLLQRPRHDVYIKTLRSLNARILFIQDGDVDGAMSVCFDGGADLYVGVGGAPEGVLAASAIKCLGGYMEGKLLFRNEDEKERATKWGIKDYNKIYTLHDLVKKDVIFSSTAVTNTSYLKGVQFMNNKIYTETLVLRSKTKTQRIIRAIHTKEESPAFACAQQNLID